MLKSYVCGLAHMGLPTGCFEKTIEFYLSLGFEIIHENANPDTNEKVAFLKLDGCTMEIYESSSSAMNYGAIDHIAFEVFDLDAVFKTLSEKKYSLIDDKIMSLPFWENGVRFFTIEGPNKEKLEFCQKN